MEDAESIVKVTRNYQVTIPSNIRLKANIKEGSFVKVVYDEKEGVIKLIPFKRKRLTIRLGRKITVEEIEEAIKEALDEATD
jgi:transcriptional regulator, AbrB family